MSRTNETRHIEWHETCKCKCRLDASVCNNKQRWNEDKCRCECKDLIDNGAGDKGFIWNPSNCECECDQSCNIGEYLDYENCKYRNKLVDNLVEECTETDDEVKLAKITLSENENKHKSSSCTLYIVFSLIIFTINIGIGAYFVYYNTWIVIKKFMLKKDSIFQATIFKCNSIKLINGKDQGKKY